MLATEALLQLLVKSTAYIVKNPILSPVVVGVRSPQRGELLQKTNEVHLTNPSQEEAQPLRPGSIRAQTKTESHAGYKPYV